MALTTRDWQRLRQQYERGATYEELAGEYGVSVATISRHRRQENWAARGAQRGRPVNGRCVEELTEQMLRLARGMLDGDSGAGVKEMRDLTALLRELLALQRMAREEQETDSGNCVRLVLEQQLEDWSV